MIKSSAAESLAFFSREAIQRFKHNQPTSDDTLAGMVIIFQMGIMFLKISL